MKIMSLSLLLTSLVVLAGCNRNGESDRAQSGVDRVVQSRTINAAYINYPPSFVVDPNTHRKTGIMNDAAVAVAEAMEVRLNYVEETTWATMIDSLNSGRVDMVVSGIWPSSTRALRADFSRVVYYSPIFAYVRANDSRFDGGLDRINDPAVRIATLDGELSAIVARTDYPRARAVAFPQQTDISQLLLQLTSNRADVTFVEAAVAAEYLARNPGSVRRVANVRPVRIFPNTFLFRKGDTGLRDAVNVALVELTNSGRLEGIVRRYDPATENFVLPATPVTP